MTEGGRHRVPVAARPKYGPKLTLVSSLGRWHLSAASLVATPRPATGSSAPMRVLIVAELWGTPRSHSFVVRTVARRDEGPAAEGEGPSANDSIEEQSPKRRCL